MTSGAPTVVVTPDGGRLPGRGGEARPGDQLLLAPDAVPVAAGDEEVLHLVLSLGPVGVAEDGCWHWQGRLDREGYGVYRADRIPRIAHRVVYELTVGPIPAGYHLDHTCHSSNRSECQGGLLCSHRRCVNPSHLEAVTPAENNHRMRTDKCKDGHIRTSENTYIRRDGAQRCLICARDYDRRRRTTRRRRPRPARITVDGLTS